jgi:prophage regulatory protein
MSDTQANNIPTFPKTGLLRLRALVGPGKPIPVSPSTWWEGVKTGRFPKPVKLGPKITAWRVEDIRALIERGAEQLPAIEAERDPARVEAAPEARPQA